MITGNEESNCAEGQLETQISDKKLGVWRRGRAGDMKLRGAGR
jgi:hypothetical protein